MISRVDLYREDHGRDLEAIYLSESVQQAVSGYRSSVGDRHDVFHFKQLFLVLALIAKYANPSRDQELGEIERCSLGDVCIQANRLCEESVSSEFPFEEWSVAPVACKSKVSLALASNTLVSAQPVYGFMAVFRAARILLSGIPRAETELQMVAGVVSPLVV